MSYYKQELIDARARKSASDDELGTVRGKLETLENSISSLSNEGKNTIESLISQGKFISFFKVLLLENR